MEEDHPWWALYVRDLHEMCALVGREALWWFDYERWLASPFYHPMDVDMTEG